MIVAHLYIIKVGTLGIRGTVVHEPQTYITLYIKLITIALPGAQFQILEHGSPVIASVY